MKHQQNDDFSDFYDDEGLRVPVVVSYEFGQDIERFIFETRDEFVLIMVFKALGYSPKDIVRILKLKNIYRYYNMSHHIRLHYKKVKKRELDV